MKLLTMLSKLLTRYPVRIIFTSLLIIALLAVGARNVEMATGNETLVSTDTAVYQDNQQLEEEFGGESIIVLYEAKNLLTPDNLEHMKGLEERLEENNAIYSIFSPVTLVEQMAEKQAESYEEGLVEIADGLEEMGAKLQESGEKLSENTSDSNRTQLPDMDAKVAELNEGFSKMIAGQEKLNDGTGQLVNGYSEFGQQTRAVGLEVKQLSNQTQGQQARQLEQLSSQLVQLSEKMMQTSEQSASLTQIPDNAINGLRGMEEGLNGQTAQLDKFQNEQAKQMQELEKLGDGLTDMGEKLVSISENMDDMISYSDTMKPGLPEKQETLDHMIYDDNGELRSMFDEVVIDEQYMTMIVKFGGNADDTTKSETVATINNYLNENPIENADTMVSGKPVLDDSIRSSMKESMQKMMMLSVIFMIIVLSLVFKVSWRLLPLLIILIAVVGTVGLMGWVNIPITMVSMAVFPILIGLGIDYAIQFHNRYTEEMNEGEDSHEQ